MADFKSIPSDAISEVAGSAKGAIKQAGSEVGKVVTGAFGQVTGNMQTPEEIAQQAAVQKQNDAKQIAGVRARLAAFQRPKPVEPPRIKLPLRAPTTAEIVQAKRKELPRAVDPKRRNEAEISGHRSGG